MIIKFVYQLIFLIPLLGIFISQFFFNKTNKSFRSLKQYTFFYFCLIFSISLILLFYINKNVGYFQFILNYPWIANVFYINFIVGLDGISLSLIVLTTFLIPLCLLSSWDLIRLRDYPLFISCMFAIEFFLLLAFSSLDLFLFYVSFESVLIPMFLIVGIYGSRERKMRASYFFFLYTLIGSLFFLITLAIILFETGTTNYIYLSHCVFSVPMQKLFWLGFFLSFAVKVPMIPFHIWLPEAHVEAPTVGSMILAGLLLKLGTYGFLRFSLVLFPQANIYFSPVVFVLGSLSIIFASLSAARQSDIKRIIAYSSIAHMNLVVIGIFTMNIDALNGTMVQMISHGFVSCALFFLIGIIYHRYHTRLIYYYSGLNHYMPIFIFFFLIFTLANISLPGTSSFVGEFLLFIGIFDYSPFIGFLGATSLVLGGIYMLWLFNRVAYTNLKQNLVYFGDVSKKEFFVLTFFCFFTILIGIKPDFLINFFNYNIINLTSLVSLKL